MGEELRGGNTENKCEIFIIVNAESGYLAQLHLLPKCIEKKKVKEVKKNSSNTYICIEKLEIYRTTLL